MKLQRKAIAGLALSASALVALVAHEGYRETAYIPVAGDRPTIGFGTANGVQMGDTTTPVKALARALSDIQKFEGALKQCVKVPLHQHEYDAWIQFSYNVGNKAFCNSTAVRKLNNGDYEGACREMDNWVNVNGRRVQGLVNRRAKERDLCLGI